jgi:hypothetical protein
MSKVKTHTDAVVVPVDIVHLYPGSAVIAPDSPERGQGYYEFWRDVSRRPRDNAEGVRVSGGNVAARRYIEEMSGVKQEERVAGSGAKTPPEWNYTLDEEIAELALTMHPDP